MSDLTNGNDLLDVASATKVFRIGGALTGERLMAVNKVSFGLSREKPEVFTIAGESGSGKTTVARLILQDFPLTEGRIAFEGTDTARIRGRQAMMRFMSTVQPVFQNPFDTFNPLRRIAEYLVETALYFRVAGTRKEAAEKADEALRLVGLSFEEINQRYPHELSGGQIQRVSVARALIPGPRLIVADEPVSMVDASLRMAIVNVFKRLRDEQGVSVLYITHDLATAYYISDRIAIMLRGQVVETGPVDRVLGDPKHPYTRLLKESVPEPTPKEKGAWARSVTLSMTEVKEYGRVGCKFAGRCPHVMDKCHTIEPPDVTHDGRLVKCHLWSDK